MIHDAILRCSRLARVTLTAAAAFPLSTLHSAPAWPTEISGHTAPAPGEHPRLFFRKADLPALREKMKTPEGQAIVKRLKETLGGGETMPAHHRPANAPFGDKTEPIELPFGAYTIGHAAGFGLLYQLTGEQKYADLGRKCFELAFEGVRDRDDKGRYGWKGSSGALRAGPTLGWYAVGYDLCYDGWDAEFRTKVAQAIQDYNEGPNTSLPELVKGSRHSPGSNHWGMQVGGGALAVLAIMNDPGIDMAKIGPLLETSRQSMIRNMTQGFGDGGFFAEGDGTGSMSSHIVFLPALQAWKIAGGYDFCTPRENAQWLALRWPFQTVFENGKPRFWPQRGGYPHNIWTRDGLSGAGYFAYGFGVVREEYKPGLLWIYNEFLKEADAKAGTPFDTPSVYPQVSVLSFINWPVGLEAKNPTGVWPHAVRDSKWNFYAWRNRWQDANDTVISILTQTAKGLMSAAGESTLSILSGGQESQWGRINGFTGPFEPAADGTTVLQTKDGGSLALDFSKLSGADVMLVMTGPGAPTDLTVDAGGQTFSFHFPGTANPPQPKADGNGVVVGQRKITVEKGRIVLSK